MSLVPSLPDSSPAVEAPPGRAIDNPAEARDAVFNSALEAVSNMQPATSKGFTLRVVNPHYIDPPGVHPKEVKRALLTGGTIGRRMRGTWELLDPSGKVVEKKTSILARVPTLQDSGVYIHNGGDYSLQFQKRLRPGVFVRRRQSGDVEAHVNVLPGQGLSHRYRLDPKTRKFRVAVSGSEIPLVPLLKALGSTDEEISNAWGKDIYAANTGDNYHTAIDKLVAKFGTKKIREHLGPSAMAEDIIRTAIGASPLDPSVSQRTLGSPIDRLSKDVILNATKRAIGVSAGTETPDDREHEAFQHIMGPEDLFAERLMNDHAGIRRTAAWKAATTGNLHHIPAGILTPQLEHVLTGSGLATHLEDVNPLEAFDRATRITPMGEGGLPDTDAIPDEARDVRPSHHGFADPSRTVESLRVGVDLNLASAARKGKDGRLYSQFIDSRSGKPTWLSAHDLAEKVVGFSHDAPDAIDTPHGRYVPAIKNNRDDYVKDSEIDVRLPNANRSYSALTNLIPFLHSSKPHRLSMGARMLTQALPLVDAEAPLVRPAAPDDSGQEAHKVYGRLAGAVRADQEGVITRVEPDRITIKSADGSEKDIALSTHHPNNRKSGFHQTPMVKVGEFVRPDTLLAKSNFTDSQGNVALGRNLLTGYLPYEGLPHEDAIAISESAARKLTSEHYYKHHAETAGQLLGTKEFASRFPTTYAREQLDKLDDTGVIRVGEKVEKGHPLVLGLKHASTALNRVHRKGEKSLQDASLTWEHDDPGEVTDVVQGPRGPVVVVKTHSRTKLADKLSGVFGDKGVISKIISDDEMPKTEDGRPLEVLVNSTGLTTRENPSQAWELIAGKVAQKTGRPVAAPGFESAGKLNEWAEDLLKKHGLKGAENVTLPKYGNKVVPNVLVGPRFIMKLHHTAEGKLSARGAGGYGSDETPTRGGPTGCFAEGTLIATPYGYVPIEQIVTERRQVHVQTPAGPERVTDWFSFVAPVTEMRTVVLSDGSVVHCTADHKWYTKDGTACKAGDLTAGTELLTTEGYDASKK